MSENNLSQENVKRLNMRGVYRCDPQLDWLPASKRDAPYHCCNWTFRVRQFNSGDYYMVDTYWATGGLTIKLSDDNIYKFEFLFDLDEVSRINPPDFYDYPEEDRFHVAMDSSGIQYSKYYFVKNGARKNPAVLIERLQRELESLENQVKHKKQEIERVYKEYQDYEFT